MKVQIKQWVGNTRMKWMTQFTPILSPIEKLLSCSFLNVALFLTFIRPIYTSCRRQRTVSSWPVIVPAEPFNGDSYALCPQQYCVRRRSETDVLLDLSAAFDTVDHATLLTVLQRRFGVCDTALAWLQSYLSDRTQNIQEWSYTTTRFRYPQPGGSSPQPWTVWCHYRSMWTAASRKVQSLDLLILFLTIKFRTIFLLTYWSQFDV